MSTDSLSDFGFRGTSLERKRKHLGPYCRPMPRVPRGALGGVSVFYGRGTPVHATVAMNTDTLSDFKFRGTSLRRKRTPLAPYRRPIPRVLGGS